MDDLELIRRFVDERDGEAFGELVRRHLDMVYSSAARQVGAGHAEDVCQVVFVELARRARTLRRDSSVGTWLYVVTRRTAVDWIRKENRRLRREREAVLEESTMDYPDWSRIGPQLDAAMEALSDEDRRALVLRFFEDRRLKEIGTALRLSEDAVQKRISRAVDKLRDALAARGIATFSAVLATELSAHAVAPAPVGFATVVAGTAHGGTAVSGVAGWLTTMAGAAALAAAVVFATHQWVGARAVAQRVATLNEELREAQGKLRTEELAGDSVRPATVRVALPYDGRVEGNPAWNAKAVTMLRAVANLRQHLKAAPDRAIPEMRLLTDKDWLETARRFSAPSTDEDYRRAFSALRLAAKNELAPRMKAALNAYEDEHGGRLPPDTLELAPYFDPPVQADILQRYMVTTHPNPHSTSDDIYERPSALVDPVYETAVSVGTGGWGTQDSGDSTDTSFALRMALSHAMRAFRADHPNQRPAPGALVPYFDNPADASAWLAARKAQ